MKTDRYARFALAVVTLALTCITQTSLLNPPLSYGASDPRQALMSLAGRWQGMTSTGLSFVWTIYEDGRYESVYRQAGREVQRRGRIEINADGSLQWRSEDGQNGTLTMSGGGSGARLLRGAVRGRSDTFQLTQIEARPASAPLARRLEVPPAPTSRVNDYASVLPDAERQRLEGLLAEREGATKAQMVVALFRSLQGENLEEYTLRVANQWGVGRAGVNDGVVLFVFHEDKKLRLEVGKGLEAVISNEVAATILKDVVAPRLAEGRLGAGIEGAINAVFSRLPAQTVAEVSSDPSQILKSLAGRWEIVSSTSGTGVWTIEEDGRYTLLWGQSDRRSGRISITPRGTLQWRSDTVKGATGVLKLDRDASGVEVIRGTVAGSAETTQARRVHARQAQRDDGASRLPTTASASATAQFHLPNPGQCGQSSVIEVVGEAPRDFNFLNEEQVKAVLGDARDYALRQCPSKATVKQKIYQVRIYLIDSPSKRKSAWQDKTASGIFSVGDGYQKLHDYSNRAAESRRVEESMRRAEEQREQGKRAADARIAAQEAERHARRARFDEFVRRHGVQEWIKARDLAANPFVFQGKRIGISVGFHEMVSESEGVFGAGPETAVLVTGIPKGFFRSRGECVLVGSVVGKGEVRLPVLGTISVPKMTFVGAHICQSWDCSDFFPK